MIRPRPLALALGLAALFASPLAFAGDKDKKQDFERGYSYTFEDDPLAAKGFDPNGAGIVVRAGAARSTLTRPRTSFVHRMLQSVENI